ncbi:hypothetical protein TNCV_1714711 [Trichonephila clavipes]|nr:hypothetical protein TNCV_1714711 [Trichonephila clavipes]
MSYETTRRWFLGHDTLIPEEIRHYCVLFAKNERLQRSRASRNNSGDTNGACQYSVRYDASYTAAYGPTHWIPESRPCTNCVIIIE